MNVLIAEDEAPAARRLERMVRERLGPRVRDLAIAPTVEAARAALASARIDLLLLDLNLNGADGFSILDAAHRPPTIVVSANSGRAIDAFNHAVIDFVAKPVSAERLGVALDRALDRTRPPAQGSLAVRSVGRIDLAAFADIVAGALGLCCERVFPRDDADPYPRNLPSRRSAARLLLLIHLVLLPADRSMPRRTASSEALCPILPSASLCSTTTSRV